MFTRNHLTAEQEISLGLIEREATNAFGTVRSRLAVRRDHPSYGVTKASLSEAFHRGVGLAQAAALIVGFGSTDSAGIAYAEDVLGIDVRALRTAIREA